MLAESASDCGFGWSDFAAELYDVADDLEGEGQDIVVGVEVGLVDVGIVGDEGDAFAGLDDAL